MVRSQNAVWEHFVKLEKVAHNQYYYVSCKYCENEDVDAPFEGRIPAMRRHLIKCSAYLQRERNNKTTESCSTVCVSNASSKRTRSCDMKLNATKLQKLDQFMDRKLTKAKVKVWHQLLLEMIADCGLSFRWVEQPSVRRMFQFLRPSVVNDLPSRRMLSGKLLEEYSLATRRDIIPRIRSLVDMGCVINFVCDGWADIAKNHILG